MDSNTTYTKTARGLRALVKKLPRDAGLVLSVIDKSLSADEILAKLDNMSEKDLEFAITWLLEGGFIKSLVTDPFPNSMWDVSKESAMQVDEIGLDEFTVSEKLPVTSPNKIPVISKTEGEIKAEAEEKAKLEAKKKMLEQADTEARERAESALKAKREAEAQALAIKEKARQDAIASAEKEAQERLDAVAKVKAETEARQKAAAEEKARLEKEEKARQDAIAKAEKEARDRAEAEARAKAEAEANARKEEEARRKAEEKAAAEEKAKLEKEEKARQDAIAKAEKEARDRAEAEARAKAKAEAKANKEEAARRKAEEKAAAVEKARLEKKEKNIAKALAQENAQQAALDKEEAKAVAQIDAEKKALGKVAAREQARLEAFAKKEEKSIRRAESKAEAQIKRERFIKNLRTKMPSKQWLITIFKSIKPISIFALAVLFLLVIAAQFINMRILINPIEKIATENIQDKVNIKTIHISLFPTPHLLLKEITIADSTTINAQKIRVYPNLINLKEKLLNASPTPYKIQKISIEGFNLAQKDISRITSWSGASSRHQQFKIEKIELNKLSINLNVVQLPYFDGDLLLDEAGLLQKANFTTESKNFIIDISQSGRDYLINIEAVRWRAPLSPYPIITRLSAKGAISDNLLTLSSISSDLYNGNLTAQINMDLNSPTFAANGTFKLKHFYIGDMAKELQLDTVVDGKLSINGDYMININKPLNTIDLTSLNAIFEIENGQLRKVDITEAMRSGNLSGKTNFNKLSGNINVKNQIAKINNLMLKDKQLQATGQISISPDSYVTGVISSKISLKNNTINSRLVIDGPITALKLKN
jgi:hypothetical protein